MSDYQTLQELGSRLLSVDEDDKARECFEKAAVIDADQADPYVGIGTVALKKHMVDEAHLAFRVACRLNPACSRAYEGLALVYQKRCDFENSFSMYLKCLELDTNNLSALLGLFQASSQMGSFAKIIYYLEQYLKMHQDDSSVMFSLATLYMKENQPKKAESMLLRTLAIAPDNKDAVNLLEEIRQNPVLSR